MILLSFDIEEFDLPLEYGVNISIEKQIEVSTIGTNIILNILKDYDIKATFFCTVTFAEYSTETFKRIITEGHEVASHGIVHSEFKDSDYSASKIKLENLSKTEIKGFRKAKMTETNIKELKAAGYTYNSSINPTYIPRRYNAISKPRTIFLDNDIYQIPASVVPYIRFPLFWLSFHHLPLKLYIWLTKITQKKDLYAHLYFHPWEFVDISNKEYNLPKYIWKNSGKKMENKFRKYLACMKINGKKFSRINEYIFEHK